MSNLVDLEKRATMAIGLRRLLLVVNALAYVGGVGACALLYTSRFDADLHAILVVNAVCWPIWLATLAGTLLAMWDLRKHREIGRLIDDERTIGYTHLAYKAGYWVLLVAVGLFLFVSFVTDVEAKAILAALVACGVAVPPLVYAFAYRA